ncbi:transcription termination/antitermination protein NusG [Spelaeicoccus albus]|uniref:Transcription termination/antitermination protein NusG n=1 Tax=Spelaeicoccus albus TaxID=1280376 RepID=A0A7Z0IJB7_9MICO|nr:transcription termination/antitermination protein NusG [Spelaeicoccus albus]NYI69348.1 transcriptional antiterminator NusG [Spelaeicoccus albus]
MSESEAGSNVDPAVDPETVTPEVGTPDAGVEAESQAAADNATETVDADQVDSVAEMDDAAGAEDVSGADDAGADDAEAAAVDPAEEFKAELRVQDGDWYVIHSYAGYENRVKANLENRIVSLNMEDFIFQIEVPMEDVVEIKNSVRKQVRRVRIPGYVLVRMELTDESWGAVRHTPGVTGFVGNAHNPVPLRIDEVFTMLAPVFETEQPEAAGSGKGGQEKASPIEVEFEVGESIMVKEGSFEGHPATVTEIKAETQKLVVLLSIFERDVPVELAFNQVAKI